MPGCWYLSRRLKPSTIDRHGLGRGPRQNCLLPANLSERGVPLVACLGSMW